MKSIKEFDALTADIAALIEPTNLIKVTDFNSCAYAIEAGKSVKGFLKKIEDKRKELVGPLNDQVKEINAYAKQISHPIETAESHIKSEVIAFENEQRKIRDELHRKMLAEQIEKELAIKKEQEKVAIEVHTENDIFGIADAQIEQLQIDRRVLDMETKAKEYDINQMGVKNARKIWKCELIDIKLVPDEFKIVTLNEKAVLAVARAGQTEIPGVRVFQETTIAFGDNTYVPRGVLK